jgi:hypothetical protein
MLLGFTLVSLCFTQIFVVTESNEVLMRRYLYETSDSSASISCSADLLLYDYYFDNNQSFEGYPLPSEFNNAILEEIDKSTLNEKLPLSSTNFRQNTRVLTNENNSLGSLLFNVIPDYIFQFITPFAYWENLNVSAEDYAILFVASRDLEDLGHISFPYDVILDQNDITLAVIDNDIFYSNPTTFNISHKIIYETLDNTGIGLALNTYIFSNFDSGLIITEKLFKKFLSSINATSYISNFQNDRTFVNAKVIHDVSKLELTKEEYQQMINLKEDIKSNLIEKMPLLTEINMMGVSSSSFESFYVLFRNVQLKLSLLAIPLVFFLCFSIYYENRVLNTKKTEITGFLKTRGITRNQFLVSEIALLLVFALAGFILGVSLAIPIILFGYTSIGFLTSLSTSAIIISGNAILYSLIIYGSLILLFSISLLISRMKRYASPDQKIKEKKLIPRKRQIILIVASSIVTSTLLALILFIPRSTISRNYYISSSIYFLITALAIGGLMLTINLIQQLLVNYFSKKLWKKNRNIFGFSLRNISINKERLKQGLLIFAAGFLVTIFFVSTSTGLISTKSDEAKYYTGADARISLTSEANLTTISKVFPSTIRSTEVLKINPINNDIISSHALSFYILDPETYSKVAYYPTSDIGVSKQKAMSSLENTNSCLIGIDRAKDFGLQIGESYIYGYQQGESSIIQNLEINHLVKAWPFFIMERTINVDASFVNAPLEIIVNYYTGQYLLNSFEDLKVKRYLLLDFTKYENDLNATKSMVQNSDDLNDLIIYKEEFQNYLNDPMVSTTINFSVFCFILTILVTISSLLFYVQKMFIDQKEQIQLYLSLGATTKQIRLLFFFEVLYLVILGTIIGFLTGLLALNFLKEITITSFFVKSFSPRISLLVLILMGVLVGGIGISLTLGLTSINRNIKRELKINKKMEKEKLGN